MAARADEILNVAVAAVRSSPGAMAEALNALPAPIYTTDAEGIVTFFNIACIAFSGRTPEVGKDRWCVTWKLYTEDGQSLPHDRCPMAVAIRENRSVRGAQAIAERPDGTRRRFRPFPTPLTDADGELIGAINMLVEISSTAEQAEQLKAQAKRCRRLARSVNDRQTVETLERMASEYDDEARELQLLH